MTLVSRPRQHLAAWQATRTNLYRPMPKLVFKLSDSQSLDFPLAGERVRLGRNASNDIVIDNSWISSFHAEFLMAPDGSAEVRDLNSSNGTTVNGERIQKSPLKPGDTVGFGQLEAIFDPLPEGVTVHLACHARAQNMGPKAAEMLKMIPGTPVDVIERCSGHGGTFGVVKPTHDVAVKVGRPVFRAANTQKRGHIVSDCPLAAQHIVSHTDTPAREPEHPIQIMARAYGLTED